MILKVHAKYLMAADQSSLCEGRADILLFTYGNATDVPRGPARAGCFRTTFPCAFALQKSNVSVPVPARPQPSQPADSRSRFDLNFLRFILGVLACTASLTVVNSPNSYIRPENQCVSQSIQMLQAPGGKAVSAEEGCNGHGAFPAASFVYGICQGGCCVSLTHGKY